MTVLKYVEPKSALNPDSGGLVVTTYRDYDLEETSKLVRFDNQQFHSPIILFFVAITAPRGLSGSGHDDLPPPIYEVHSAALRPRSHGSQGSL